MKDLIEWLMHIERIAAKLYRDAGIYFRDPAFVEFLQHSAEDEAFHYQTLAEALKIFDAHPDVESVFVIDQEIRATIEKSFSETQDRLIANSLTKADMIDCMVATEYSEWNEIFLYVVNTLKRIHPEFKSVAAKLQGHLRYIEHYFSSDDYGHQKVVSIKKIGSVWTEKILIIEDDPSITELLAAVLKGEVAVDTAENGKQGFEKIQQNYYRLIISDIDMPVMDGITLFKKVSKEYPGIENRYLFFTGYPTESSAAFLQARGIKMLLKPVRLEKLKKTIWEGLNNIHGN